MGEIHSGDLSLGLASAIGGSVAFFRKGAADLMRPFSEADRARGDVLGVAMFPMAPYANRIVGNAFTFEGRRYRFAANNPPEKFNVHGTAWHLPWTERRVAADEAVLELVHDAPDEPYSYAARQRFKLMADSLVVDTEVENRGVWTMPFGFGQHPWFEPDANALVTFAAKVVWLIGQDGVPTERLRTPPEFDHATPRTLPRNWRGLCYGDWDGKVEIVWPRRKIGLRMEADAIFKHLMLYSDPQRPALCIEPQTNAVSAFALIGEDLGGYDLGIVTLKPGEKAAGSIRFTPFAI